MRDVRRNLDASYLFYENCNFDVFGTYRKATDSRFRITLRVGNSPLCESLLGGLATTLIFFVVWGWFCLLYVWFWLWSVCFDFFGAWLPLFGFFLAQFWLELSPCWFEGLCHSWNVANFYLLFRMAPRPPSPPPLRRVTAPPLLSQQMYAWESEFTAPCWQVEGVELAAPLPSSPDHGKCALSVGNQRYTSKEGLPPLGFLSLWFSNLG